MADSDASYTIETEQQLWDELEEVVALTCPAHAHESIDDGLRRWLHLGSRCHDAFAASEDDVLNCAQRLIQGPLFRTNPEYVRTQIIYSLLQEDEPGPLSVIASFLLLDGRNDEITYRRMIDEGCFPRLMELILGRAESDVPLHRLLLDLMYEMSRIEKLRPEDLAHIDDGFVTYLFGLIEALFDDANDPYQYPIIKVLLVLNEQYMVASTTAAPDAAATAAPLTNRVVKCLSLCGDSYRTFGENLILLLNRETETSLQLLILKLLYLLFTTKATYEYFYTNDLRVLLDVIIRNLLDLPNELMALRHTYLRVLYPLLAHTQLSKPPHYKRDEVTKVLRLLAGSGNVHFAPIDDTTARLVDRVSKVKWLTDDGSGEMARRLLGISLDSSETGSKVSVVDVAAVTEKPGVQTPSRRAEEGAGAGTGAASEGQSPVSPEKPGPGESEKHAAPKRPRKALPEVPKHRHGVPFGPPSAAAAGGNSNGTVKKIPPKAPPPRRGARLRAAEAAPAPLP